MRTYLRWISIAALLAGLALPHVAAAAPVTNVQPPAGPPGTRFLFFASEFGSVEHIDIWLNAPDGRVVAARSPELGRSTVNGDASWTWTAPDNAALGAWQMVAHGHDTKIERVIPFTIGQPAPPASAGQPYGVYPANGPAGTLFRFFANGFRDREPIDVSVVGPAGRLKSPSITTSPAGVAAPGGRVDGGWTSPRDAAPGAWQIVVHGNDSGVTRTIPVTIGAAPARPPAQLTVQPSTGAPGARFVASASGFGANELISVWLNTPDGRVLAAEIEGRAQAGPAGQAGWGWIAPKDAPRGAWQMVAHGRESGIEVVASFTVS